MFKLMHCKLSILLSLFFMAGFSHAANPLLKTEKTTALTAQVNQVDKQTQSHCTTLISPDAFLDQSAGFKKGVTYFSHDSILISQPFVELIAKQADQLSHHSDTCVFLAGYSDSIGPAHYNQQLSFERAHEVAKMMIYLGVNPEQIITVGYGEQFGETESELAKQRRVDWYLTNALGKL